MRLAGYVPFYLARLHTHAQHDHVVSNRAAPTASILNQCLSPTKEVKYYYLLHERLSRSVNCIFIIPA